MPHREASAHTAEPSRWIYLLAAIFCGYATLFIYRTSFVIDGVRYFSLLDDEMISMRYARNFAHGYGLVWNPGGEGIEGYTNLGWVLFMAVVHCVPIAEAKISLVVQATEVVVLVLNLFVVQRLARRFSQPTTLAAWATTLTAFYYPLVNWSLQGTEVGPLTLLTSIAVVQALSDIDSGDASYWPYLTLTVASLIRVDFLVPLAALTVFSMVTDPRHRTRHLWIGGCCFLLSLGGQTAFCVLYYHDILPNTYYLKMTGVALSLRVARGLWVAGKFVVETNWVLFLIPLVAARQRGDRAATLLATMVLTQIAYSVYVGGDAWEWAGGSNRFIAPVMPLFFVLFADAVTRAASWLRVPWPAFGVFMLASFLSFNGLGVPGRLAQLALIERPFNVESSATMVRQALAIKRITSPEATIAVEWAGAIPYFADRYAIDLLGKSDRVIAHEPVKLRGFSDFRNFMPGHNKWDLDYSIGVLQPDVITPLRWELPASQESRYEPIRVGDLALLAKRESAHIYWERVERRSGYAPATGSR